MNTESAETLITRLKRDKLSRTAVIVLLELDKSERTATEICRKYDFSNATLTIPCDQLEDRGLINRTRRRDDRRKVTLSLTASGRRKLQELLA